MIHLLLDLVKVLGDIFASGVFSHTPDKQPRANGITLARSLAQPTYNFGRGPQHVVNHLRMC